MKIKVKPLSVNNAWQGKRFKTQDYKSYEQELFYLLPSKINIPAKDIVLSITFGISKNSDIDNPIKPFLDILQKKYNFNDKNISKLILTKTEVKKGEEFISFEFN